MWKAILSVSAFVLVVAGLVLASSGGTSQARQEFGLPEQRPLNQEVVIEPTPVFVCYEVQRGDDVATDVRLYTQNFGGDLVRVRQLVQMCELSLKYTPVAGQLDPTPPTPRIFACYTIDRSNAPDDPYILDTGNFDEDLVIVQNGNLMCEEAEKHVDGRDPSGAATGLIWHCFKLAEGDDPGAGFRVINQNFGRDDVKAARSVQMCESATKTRLTATGGGTVTSGDPALHDVLQCYRLNDGQDVKTKAVIVTDNFGRDEVALRQAVLMCEMAEKRPVFTLQISRLPTPTPTASTGP